jgi:translation initiation factor eIF-2B subunit epsilon
MKNTENFDPSKMRKALIIADSFTNLLNPINEEIPDVLIPVCNVPVLEYMIDFLFSNSIKEIIILAKRQANILTKYINKHYKKNKAIKLITSEDFSEMGDCLRKVYNEKLISAEFVLIRGLVIANFNLEKVFDYHMDKRKVDKNCIMTSIFKKYKNDSNVKTKYDQNVVIYDSSTNHILQYESIYNNSKIELNDNLKFNIPKPKNNEVTNATKYTIRTDFYDTFIDICSVDVLNHFAENFDYHSIRDDLYKNVICSEIYVDQFYLYEITENDYVGVIKNFESYNKVSFEIVNRWAHPVVLEHLLISGKLDINYKTMNANVYLDGESTIKGRIFDSTVVGSGSLIEEGAKLSSCIMGKNTVVRNRSKLKKCIIYSDCEIDEDVTLENVVLGNNVKITSNTVIKNCYIGDNIVLPEGEFFDQRIKIDKFDDEGAIEYTQHEDFLKNLEDKDIMFVEYQEEETNDDDDEESSIVEEEEEEEENFDDEVKYIVKGGGKPEDIVLELISLQKAIWEKTIYDSIYVLI